MPAAIAVPAIASVIAGGTAAGATIYGSRKAGQSARRAQTIQSKSDDVSLQFERERDAEARRQWEAQQQFQAKQFAAQEEERLNARKIADYNQRLAEERETRRAPYRAASQAALQSLAERLGLNLPAPSGGGSAPSAPSGGGVMPPPMQRPPSQSGPVFWPPISGGPLADVTGPFMSERQPVKSSPYAMSEPQQLAYDPSEAVSAGQLLKLQPRRRLV